MRAEPACDLLPCLSNQEGRLYPGCHTASIPGPSLPLWREAQRQLTSRAGQVLAAWRAGQNTLAKGEVCVSRERCGTDASAHTDAFTCPAGCCSSQQLFLGAPAQHALGRQVRPASCPRYMAYAISADRTPSALLIRLLWDALLCQCLQSRSTEGRVTNPLFFLTGLAAWKATLMSTFLAQAGAVWPCNLQMSQSLWYGRIIMGTTSKSASACRSVLLHSTNIPAVASLTDIVGPEGSAKAGTFTPPGAGASLSCNIPELVRRLIRPHHISLPS